MNGRYRIDYMRHDGVLDYVILGDERQAITYAIAYRDSGYSVLGLKNEYTGEDIDFSKMPVEEIQLNAITEET